jgi:hypothetical protein
MHHVNKNKESVTGKKRDVSTRRLRPLIITSHGYGPQLPRVSHYKQV